MDYFKELMEKRRQSKGNFDNWDSTIKHFIKFAGTKVSFREIDQTFCENFREYLKNTAKKKSGEPLSSSSVSSYLNKFRACLKEAVKKKIILSNPADDVANPKVVKCKYKFESCPDYKIFYSHNIKIKMENLIKIKSENGIQQFKKKT